MRDVPKELSESSARSSRAGAVIACVCVAWPLLVPLLFDVIDCALAGAYQQSMFMKATTRRVKGGGSWPLRDKARYSEGLKDGWKVIA